MQPSRRAVLSLLCLAACQKPAAPPPPATAAPVHAAAPPKPAAPIAEPVDAGRDFDGIPEQQVDSLALAHAHLGLVDHLARARDLKDKGEFEAALLEARRALTDDPEDEDAYWLAYRCGRAAAETDLAVAALETLAKLRPEDANPYIHQARLWVTDGAWANAVESALKATAREPQNAEGYQVLGRAHLSGGALEAAILAFEAAVERNPEHGYALNNLGFAYLRANRNEDAVEVLTQAALALPHLAYVHNNLGVALERSERPEQAQAAYLEAMRLSPNDVKAQVNSTRVGRLASAKAATSGLAPAQTEAQLEPSAE